MAAESTPWPNHRRERRSWVTSADARSLGGRRPPIEDRLLDEIEVEIPPHIADLTPTLSAKTIAPVAAAAAAAARLDESAVTQLGALSGFLLRSESVATSRIERIDADLDDIARASIGQIAGDSARQITAAAAALLRLIDTSGSGITEVGLLRAHHDLLSEDPLERAHAGRYRDRQNWLGGSDFTPRDAVHVPPPHDLVPSLMADLVEFANRTDLPSMAQAALAHAQFESIHPFTDGNGRIGRGLINGVFRARQLTTRVAVPVASVMLAEVDDYFDHLAAYRNGDTEGIVHHLAVATITASEASLVSAERLTGITEAWTEAAGRPRPQAVARMLIDRLLANPVLTYRTAVTVTGASQAGVYRAIDRLTDAGVLTEITGKGRDRVWIAGDVFEELDRLQARIGPRQRPSGA